jgi:hypothetical protein
MKPRLTLHIGTHKTATSTLQALMAENRSQLKAEGILYPSTDRPPLRSRRKHAFLGTLLHKGGPEFDAMLADLRAEVAASGCDRVLMSAEGLSGPTLRPDPAALAALAGAFDLTAVCFLRRQDTFAESLWNQRCKTGNEKDDIGAFVNSARMVRHMDYVQQLAPWAEVGNVVAVGFETAKRDGVAEVFSAASGIALPSAPKDRNVSPSMLSAAYMAVLNRLGIGFAWKQVQAAVAILHAEDPAPMQRRALGRNLRNALLDRLAEANDDLSARYGVMFPDDLPDEPDHLLNLPSEASALRLARMMAKRRRKVRTAR